MSFTTCTLLTSQLGVKHHRVVAYRGTGPALNDLVGGQVDYMCDQIVNLVEQVKGGTIKAYAIATPERSPALPDVPTTKEAGLPDYQVSAWNALFAPKGTPKEIVAKLNDALVEGARRRGDAQAPARARQRHPGQGRPFAAGAGRPGQERGRALDADPQGRRRGGRPVGRPAIAYFVVAGLVPAISIPSAWSCPVYQMAGTSPP